MLNDEAERTMLFLHVWGHPAPAFHRAHGLCARAALRRVLALPSSQHLLCWLLPWQLVFHTFLGCKANRLMQSLPISTRAGAQSSHQGRRPLPQQLLSLLGRSGWCRWPWPWPAVFPVSAWTHLSHGAQRPPPNGCLNPRALFQTQTPGEWWTQASGSHGCSQLCSEHSAGAPALLQRGEALGPGEAPSGSLPSVPRRGVLQGPLSTDV